MKIAAVLAAAVTLVAALVIPAEAAAPRVGSLRITVTTPAAVPANVVVTGPKRLLIPKPASGTSVTVTREVPVGIYLVWAPRVVSNGSAYVGTVKQPAVLVQPGRVTSVDVRYKAEGGAHDLRVTALNSSSASLAWAAPSGSRFVLRRTKGRQPASHTSVGIGVPVNGSTAADKGLAAGTEYSYTLFTLYKGRWYGPLVLTVSTTSTDPTAATYVAPSSTLLARPQDVVSATPTGDGVRLVLAANVGAPQLGAGVVLPVSSSLPGGYLGVARALSDDGRTIDVVAGGLSDAFDYYELDVDDFVTEPVQPEEDVTEPPAGAKAKAAAAASCKGSGGGPTVSFTPSVTMAGHFKTKVDKYSVFGAEVPVGASVDVGLTATVTGSATVAASAGYECGLKFGKLVHTLAVTPVPISLSLTPTAQVSVKTSLKLSNIGLKATAGIQVSGSMSVKNGASFSGSPIMNVTPLTPTIEANGTVAVKVGGDLVLGPGAGTANAGVVAGIGGELTPLDASFGPHFSANDSRFNTCLRATANFTRSLNMSAKAWIGNWDISKTITLDALTGSTPYPGTPWYLPSGCNNIANPGSPDTLLGSGVSKVDDSTLGAADQWGHVDGFAPGKKTWVLSTGTIANAVGTPDQLASTDLEGDGDASLTDLAGFTTYDAAAYQITVVPTGHTLHVKYVFASEEYPEYVGSNYNDVMAVWVNGTNCAKVPGTNQPVSVNTINANENSDLYVDNSTGAAGYATSMDALTVPLTCSVPVTPGQQVTVRIGVADTSDHVLDSAVALLDGGIWTD